MIIVPVGYALAPEVTETSGGGGPYGATHLSPMGDDSGISEDERQIALAHAAQVHWVAEKLAS